LYDLKYFSKGISKLRISSDGKSLPSARKIQVQLFLYKQTNIPDINNQLLMQWGQFVAHDVSILEIDVNGEGDNDIIMLFVCSDTNVAQ
jgi:hypothetical protein